MLEVLNSPPPRNPKLVENKNIWGKSKKKLDSAAFMELAFFNPELLGGFGPGPNKFVLAFSAHFPPPHIWLFLTYLSLEKKIKTNFEQKKYWSLCSLKKNYTFWVDLSKELTVLVAGRKGVSGGCVSGGCGSDGRTLILSSKNASGL